jgi:hypothetical protein
MRTNYRLLQLSLVFIPVPVAARFSRKLGAGLFHFNSTFFQRADDIIKAVRLFKLAHRRAYLQVPDRLEFAYLNDQYA